MEISAPPVTGLDPDGFLAREGSIDLVPDLFAPVVAAAWEGIAAAFGPELLHSAYLYGSIPRGTARPGSSDLDLLLALHRPPTPADRAAAKDQEAFLDDSFPQIDGVGILLYDTATLLSELERYDLGWFLACLCTPLLGPDLAEQLPRYRPTPLLARETNGDLHLAVPRWQAQRDTADPQRLTRIVSRRLLRSALTLVMPRWGGWTSDLARSAEIAAHYYPERAEQLRRAATATPADLPMLLDELAPWLAAEYLAVHGPKAPRP
ncbi:nucleotidyltransferase [Kitasatospora sp. MMS16-BH015]|uniref:nucleotidyltransferase domain-containing protein n=1 Tax=Kitasatospora sp. MMS16-BH015 TaxID=2018025 RepID=UPI000CA303E8|nr:nucleotidyltransferase [Kitasatospora sp. MMS16-BH015]